MANWLIDKDTIYLVPIKDISMNEPGLGNHPSVESIKSYLDDVGKESYSCCLDRRREAAENLLSKSAIATLDGHLIWSGHFICKGVKKFSYFWGCPHTSHEVPFMKTFDDLIEYVRTQGVNMSPIRAIVENDGEIVLMEGRHRLMAAYILNMKDISCILQLRGQSYEPEFDKTLQKIKDLRFISPD